MLVLRTEAFHISPLLLPLEVILRAFISVQENRSVILHIHPLRTLYGKATRISTRKGGIQRKQDAFSVTATNHGIYYVTLLKNRVL